MPKKRDSVRHAEWAIRYRNKFERLARDIAFEADVQLEVRELQVFIRIDDQEELLCIALQAKRLWHTAWLAMCKRFPQLKRNN
jgi:hypothetical protein